MSFKFNRNRHGFHLVDPSPWPLISAFSAFSIVFALASWMHGYGGSGFPNIAKLTIYMGLTTLICGCLYPWWKNVIEEGLYEGQHTFLVQKGLRLGMILFIVSEVMFFVAFFWAFFHVSFNPSIVLGGVWPPAFMTTLDPWKVPLLNTVLLLSSGASITWSHHSLTYGDKGEALLALIITFLFAYVFILLQKYEYLHAPFTISDSVYGSTFYLATGFHGFHVMIGTTFIYINIFRMLNDEFSKTHHFGFEAAAWYWHFVDVVWLFLFLTIYWWGS